MEIKAGDLHFKLLNEQLKVSDDCNVKITECLGQRYIGSGVAGKNITIQGTPGNALGAYLAGGTIIVLGLDCKNHEIPVGDFCGTGMHGGIIYIRTSFLPNDLPSQVSASIATEDNLVEIYPLIEEYCNHFGASKEEILKESFYKLTANSKKPYKQLYTHN